MNTAIAIHPISLASPVASVPAQSQAIPNWLRTLIQNIGLFHPGMQRRLFNAAQPGADLVRVRSLFYLWLLTDSSYGVNNLTHRHDVIRAIEDACAVLLADVDGMTIDAAMLSSAKHTCSSVQECAWLNYLDSTEGRPERRIEWLVAYVASSSVHPELTPPGTGLTFAALAWDTPIGAFQGRPAPSFYQEAAEQLLGLLTAPKGQA